LSEETGAISSNERAGVADLHMHSRASDGEWSPAKLVAAARREGLSAIALTDHDTISGLPEAEAAGQRHGIAVLAGVELSTWMGFDLHILAYGFDPEDPGLSRLLGGSAKGRRARAERIVERLNELGFALRMEDVLAEAGEGVVGRPHVARALVASGQLGSVREAFDVYLGDGKPACIDKARIEPARAIEVVHAAGGVAVCAHPGTYGGPELLDPLVDAGLDGVEVLHSLHGSNSVQSFGGFADRRGLAKTGGSDFHGPRSHGLGVGSVAIPREWLQDLEERIRRRREERSLAAAVRRSAETGS
jgi:predicted metal-dependent phosphoesterase TrpH